MKTNASIINSLTVFFSLIIVCNFISLNEAAAEKNVKDTVLILGFQSSSMNDVQVRLLRDAILKKCHTQGFSIVSLMDIESLNISNMKNIQSYNQKEIVDYNNKFQATLTVTGEVVDLSFNTKLQHTSIKPHNRYECTISIYDAHTKSFKQKRFIINSGKNLLIFIKRTSDVIVSYLKIYRK